MSSILWPPTTHLQHYSSFLFMIYPLAATLLKFTAMQYKRFSDRGKSFRNIIYVVRCHNYSSQCLSMTPCATGTVPTSGRDAISLSTSMRLQPQFVGTSSVHGPHRFPVHICWYEGPKFELQKSVAFVSASNRCPWSAVTFQQLPVCTS